MFLRWMLLRWRYFIILEGAKTQKTVSRSVLPLLRKCTHARCYTSLYCIVYTLQHYNDRLKNKSGKSEKFHSVLLIVVTRYNVCTRLPFLNCKRTNLYCITEPKWAKVCRLPRCILHTTVWSKLHDLLASMKRERLIRPDAMFQSGDK